MKNKPERRHVFSNSHFSRMIKRCDLDGSFVIVRFPGDIENFLLEMTGKVFDKIQVRVAI